MLTGLELMLDLKASVPGMLWLAAKGAVYRFFLQNTGKGATTLAKMTPGKAKQRLGRVTLHKCTVSNNWQKHGRFHTDGGADSLAASALLDNALDVVPPAIPAWGAFHDIAPDLAGSA